MLKCTIAGFGCPQTSSDLKMIKDAGVPNKTKLSMPWDFKAWKEWSKDRANNIIEDEECVHQLSDAISDMSAESISFWLPKFVVEARRKNGLHYPPNSLYALCCGLQRYLRSNNRSEVNIFTDSGFF